MDLLSIYISNGVGIFLMLILFYASRTRILRRHTEDNIYSLLILGVLLGCTMEAVSYTLDGVLFPGSRLLNYAANTYLYIVNLLLPFGVMVYVDLGLYGDLGRVRKHYMPHIIIGLGMICCTVVNFFVPISYVITDQNVYERRPFSYVYYFVILFYFFTAMAVKRRYEKENGDRTFFSVKMFLFPVIIGSGLQFLFYGLSLAWLSAAVGLVGMFMMQQNETAYLDFLSDTYNRQYLNDILSAWIARGKSFAGAMLDIDRFKRINDAFGHSEGDKVIRSVADILKSAQRDNERVFRFAGDEFIVLKQTDTPDGLADYLEEAVRRLEEYNRQDRPYQIALSYGTSFFETGDIDTFMKEMDDRMYAMKEEHHTMMP